MSRQGMLAIEPLTLAAHGPKQHAQKNWCAQEPCSLNVPHVHIESEDSTMFPSFIVYQYIQYIA